MLQIFKIGFIGLCVIVDDILPIYWQLACRLNIGKRAHKIALFIEVPTKHQEFSLFCDIHCFPCQRFNWGDDLQLQSDVSANSEY